MKLVIYFFAYFIFPALILVAAYRCRRTIEPIYDKMIMTIDGVWAAMVKVIMGDG